MIEQKGIWIAFEGNDGSGKTTMLENYAIYLEESGLEIVRTREPGGNPFSEALRPLIFSPVIKDDPLSQLYFFLAARKVNIEKTVLPAFKEGKIVLSDRSEGSTFAYQGYQLGLPPGVIKMYNDTATDGVHPNLTVLLDVDIEVARGRKKKVDDNNHFDDADIEGWLKRKRGFLSLAREHSWIVVDANQDEELVLQDVIKEVRRRNIIPGLSELPSLQS